MMKYWDVLKASKGLYVSDSYAMIWGQKISGDGQIYEITDIPPLTFVSNGTELIDYRISGNTIQNGVPSPDNPVEVVGCGERTENLFDGSKSERGYITNTGEIAGSSSSSLFTSDFISVEPNGTYSITKTNSVRIVAYDENKIKRTSSYADFTISEISGGTFKVTSTDKYIRFSYNINLQDTIMLTSLTGSTPPDHYIPYGYKIPVTVTNGTETVTTPVYIGSEPLHKIGAYADYAVRKSDGTKKRFNRIKKLVLTGEEDLELRSINPYGVANYRLQVLGRNASTLAIMCTHYTLQNTAIANTRTSGLYNGSNIFIRDTSIMTLTDFKSYLAAQYEQGTPVTIWYVLAEPEEEPLENLLPIQTIKGTNILTADTTVQQSEMYIKYRR